MSRRAGHWALPAALERIRRELEAARAEALREGVHSADVVLDIPARQRAPPRPASPGWSGASRHAQQGARLDADQGPRSDAVRQSEVPRAGRRRRSAASACASARSAKQPCVGEPTLRPLRSLFCRRFLSQNRQKLLRNLLRSPP
ncbi:hypothetical protein EOE48_03730 [Methylobacterium oryzihabitans]|uniref:Uncharacterized protein n=1 Tax=Methylobacterium oryzihabitans TaxID=2499852 RepID=A0A3S3UD08_9HYPH|nr:hypothetical protein EOE48_03730 [Methylobacterium oryzihabitans]